MALDHPDAISKLGILDVIPTAEQWDVADKGFSFGVEYLKAGPNSALETWKR